MIRLTPGVDYSPEYLAKVEASQARITRLIGGWQGPEHDAERAELLADQRRQAKRDARHAAGKLSEHEEQCIVVDWLEARGHKVFAVCNGVVFGMSRESACRYSAYLRAEGKRKGVPDLWIGPPHGSRVWTVLEMKQVGGADPSTEQREWLDYCEMNGMRALVAFGHEQAIERLMEAGY